MKTYLKLAWRNIWRNKRRTLLTASSISLAIFLALLMRSLQTGVWESVINNIIQSYTGSIQIHKNGYWEQKEDINNTFELNDSLTEVLNANDNISLYVPRLESFALASEEEQTKGIALVGIIPETEDRFANISKKIIEGKFLKANDDGVLVAERLADFLKIKVNDTLVMIGQGFQGASAAGKYPVRGIIHFPSPEMDNRMVYMNLPLCQEFFSCENRLTSISLALKNPDKVDKTISELKNTLNTGQYEVMKWDEMLVEIVQTMKTKNVGSYILLGIFYMIVAFGIFGTVLMMTAERIKEFGVVISIGMQKSKLAVIVAIEMIYIGIIGIIIGMVAATPIIYYFHSNPIRLSGPMAKTMVDFGIDPVLSISFRSDIYIAHSMIVMIIVLFAIIYPIRKVIKLNIINALRSK
jgi:ABC-type lipoprotein release transport system permease subunit